MKDALADLHDRLLHDAEHAESVRMMAKRMKDMLYAERADEKAKVLREVAGWVAELLASAPLAQPGAGSTGAPELEKLAKIGALALQLANLSTECSEALTTDVLSEIMRLGVIEREKQRAVRFGAHRVREG